MRELMAANLVRLRKTPLFWGAALLHGAFAMFRIYTIWDDRKYGYQTTLDEALFTYIMIAGLVMAVFIAVFLGTEYSDGTVRNKIAAGHSRGCIYLANLLTVCIACLLFTAVYLLAALAVGLPVLGGLTLGAGAILTTLLGTLATAAASRWMELHYAENVPLDQRYMIFVLLSGIILSAFCSLFLGAEYSDGTIRSKIAAGHTRTAVYLSNLTLCIAAGILLCLGYIAAFLAVGIPLLGLFQTGLPVIVRCTLDGLLMTAALAAVFTLLSMLGQNKAAVAVISIFLAYFLLFLGIFLYSRLSEPEITPAQEYIYNGQILLREAAPNPAYVRGVKRAVYQFLFVLPGCQAIYLAQLPGGPLWTLPVCSGGVLAACTGIGLALFGRKDIR